jgi:hypothetical protein
MPNSTKAAIKAIAIHPGFGAGFVALIPGRVSLPGGPQNPHCYNRGK